MTGTRTTWSLVRYFLYLGSLGFGGPAALVGYMQRDLVESRDWFTKDEYLKGLALSQLAPGPLAAQLAICLGYTHGGIWGATLVGVAFVAPSFLMTVALGMLYVAFGGLPWMQGVFYGIGAAVIAIIARGAGKLLRTTVGRDALLRLAHPAVVAARRPLISPRLRISAPNPIALRLSRCSMICSRPTNAPPQINRMLLVLT